ncbi:MAG: tRNA-dihydrouridine synthase [Clostridia bacterium]|nr:tRNA-dihydrouridine synthase [Clostridia bacterium]
MEIGNIKVENNIFLAPMAGVNDVGFRALASFFGAGMTYTEMVSAKGLIYGEGKSLKNILNQDFINSEPKMSANKTAWLLLTENVEDKKAIQIFGSDPKFMINACQSDYLDKFDLIDINMGCPAPKIIKNGEGSALMKDIEKAEELIKACVSSTNKPISVKFRKGYKKDNAVEFAKMCERAGASVIAIHPRFTSQGYGGIADYEVIKEVKKAVKIPVIGSGDVKDFETYKRILETGVDGVMIGRASLGNPMIFKQLNDFNNKKTPIPLFKFIQKGDFFKDIISKEDLKTLEENENYIKYLCAKKHVTILRRYFAENYLTKYMRKHMLWYASGLKSGADLKQKIARSVDLDQSLEWLKNSFLL